VVSSEHPFGAANAVTSVRFTRHPRASSAARDAVATSGATFVRYLIHMRKVPLVSAVLTATLIL
jgi:hypothetical protein